MNDDGAAAGREIIPANVDRLWMDLIEGRRSPGEVLAAAQAMLDTVNVVHVANWGLTTLYGLLASGPTVERDRWTEARDRWRAEVRRYEASPEGWDRSYYMTLVTRHGEHHGRESAQWFGDKLVAQGLLDRESLAAALGRIRSS